MFAGELPHAAPGVTSYIGAAQLANNVSANSAEFLTAEHLNSISNGARMKGVTLRTIPFICSRIYDQ